MQKGISLFLNCKEGFIKLIFIYQIKFLQTSLNSLNARNCDLHAASEYWQSLGNVISEEINNSSQVVSQMFDEEYPKLLKYYYDMVKKLNCEHFVFTRNVLEKSENAYLSNSLSRLLENTQNIFNIDNAAPNHDQIDSLCRTITR